MRNGIYFFIILLLVSGCSKGESKWAELLGGGDKNIEELMSERGWLEDETEFQFVTYYLVQGQQLEQASWDENESTALIDQVYFDTLDARVEYYRKRNEIDLRLAEYVNQYADDPTGYQEKIYEALFELLDLKLDFEQVTYEAMLEIIRISEDGRLEMNHAIVSWLTNRDEVYEEIDRYISNAPSYFEGFRFDLSHLNNTWEDKQSEDD